MNQMDPINERMRTVGNLAEALERVRNEAAKRAIEEAIGLLIHSVKQVLHPVPAGRLVSFSGGKE